MGIIGIDEVGRGCWAGPLLIVASRQVGELPTSLKDSKLLTRKQRELLFYDIEIACDVGEGWVQSAEIDKLGLTKAMCLGVERALTSLKAEGSDHIIMDGPINYCPKQYVNVECVIKADALHPAVSAASVYAKIKRDRFMQEAAKTYPQYQFEKHVGYGTKQHLDALKQWGVCNLHRKSFKPVYTFSNL